MDSGGGATTICMPYRHIRDAQPELAHLNSIGSDAEWPEEERGSGAFGEGGRKGAPKWRVVLACMVAAGMQFGWALQLSLLTPTSRKLFQVKASTVDKFSKSDIIVFPSILSANFAKLGEHVKAVEVAGCDWIHVDVMDGRFVPNITIGPLIVDALRPVTDLPLDVHLMIMEPEQRIPDFIKAGDDIVSVHCEQTATIHLHRAVDQERHIRLHNWRDTSSPLLDNNAGTAGWSHQLRWRMPPFTVRSQWPGYHLLERGMSTPSPAQVLSRLYWQGIFGK